jgi:bacterioferritin
MGTIQRRQQLIDGLNEDLAANTGRSSRTCLFASWSGPASAAAGGFLEGEIATSWSMRSSCRTRSLRWVARRRRSRRVTLSHDNREMLQIALQAEKDTIERYTQRIKQAEAAGELGLKVELENLVAEETRHKEDLERILFGWNA